MDLISRKAAIKFAKEQMVKETGAYSKGRNAALLVMKSALNNPDAIPSVPAVPLDKLCEMLSKSNVNVPCNDDCEGCEAFDGTGDTVNCWKATLIKWMEEQDAGN